MTNPISMPLLAKNPAQKIAVSASTTPSKRGLTLAGHLVPLRAWIGLDLLNTGDVSENLDALLKSLLYPAAELAYPAVAGTAQPSLAAREWNQMLTLARQMLADSRSAIGKTLGIVVALQKSCLDANGQSGEDIFSKKYANNFWPEFCRQWLGKPPGLLLTHIALLGAVYGNLAASQKLLAYAAQQLVPAWTLHARLMLVVGFENDMAMAEAIYKHQLATSSPKPELIKIQAAMKTLREIAQLRKRLDDEVLNQKNF